MLKHTSDQTKLNEWKARVGERQAELTSKKARDRGTNVHDFIDQFLNNKEVVSNSFDMTLFTPLKTTLAKNIGTIFLQEKALLSKTLKIAGRCDCIAEWDKEPAIIDFKTANNPKKKEWIEDYFLQATAYKIMWEEITDQYIPKIVVVITSEAGIIQVFDENPSKYFTKLLLRTKKFYDTL